MECEEEDRCESSWLVLFLLNSSSIISHQWLPRLWLSIHLTGKFLVNSQSLKQRIDESLEEIIVKLAEPVLIEFRICSMINSGHLVCNNSVPKWKTRFFPVIMTYFDGKNFKIVSNNCMRNLLFSFKIAPHRYKSIANINISLKMWS